MYTYIYSLSHLSLSSHHQLFEKKIKYVYAPLLSKLFHSIGARVDFYLKTTQDN